MRKSEQALHYILLWLSITVLFHTGYNTFVTWKKFKKKVLGQGINVGGEIEPDQIFLDSSNLPQFDTHQFEGRLEQPISRGTFLWLSISFLIVGLLFSGRLFALQIASGEAYATRSQDNHLQHTAIFANRGIIYDRSGVPLAWNDLNVAGDFSLRSYYKSSGFSHLVGFVKYPAKDSKGFYYEDTFTPKGGVEEFFNEELSGTNGLKITETDAFSEIKSESTLTDATDGENITLTVDSRIQEKLYEALRNTVTERGFAGGAAVIMDIHNGEILALTNFPEFGQSVMADGANKEAIDALINDKRNPFLNRVVSGQFIPGSIIKPFLATGVLEEGIISPTKQILSTGALEIPNPYDSTKSTIFKDWKAHGLVDLRRALAVSSNVYFFTVGGGHGDQKGIGILNIEKYTRGFGFGSLTGINVAGEKEGNVPSPAWKTAVFDDDWRLGDTFNSSIGQFGFQVTPVQALRAVAAIANQGTLIVPTIIERNSAVGRYSKTLPYSEDNLKIVREGMRLGVLEGTASGLNVSYVQVAAKTGTAELDASKTLVNSWVIGYFPYNAPRYSFAVMMERGPYANQIGATSAMRQLLDWMSVNAPEYLK
jgi:penicillin-binding protein 2